MPEGQRDDPSRQRRGRWSRLRAAGTARLRPVREPARAHRLLFLDDDPHRARVFLKDHPDAVWVTTVPECLARLAEPWDEVHLDHDLGGQHFVDSKEADCGMEVIRWLCKEPRVHLKDSLFVVHTHNATAGRLMVLQLRAGGYQAEFRPFGLAPAKVPARHEPEAAPAAEARPPAAAPWRHRLLSSCRGWLARRWGVGGLGERE